MLWILSGCLQAFEARKIHDLFVVPREGRRWEICAVSVAENTANVILIGRLFSWSTSFHVWKFQERSLLAFRKWKSYRPTSRYKDSSSYLPIFHHKVRLKGPSMGSNLEGRLLSDPTNKFHWCFVDDITLTITMLAYSDFCPLSNLKLGIKSCFFFCAYQQNWHIFNFVFSGLILSHTGLVETHRFGLMPKRKPRLKAVNSWVSPGCFLHGNGATCARNADLIWGFHHCSYSSHPQKTTYEWFIGKREYVTVSWTSPYITLGPSSVVAMHKPQKLYMKPGTGLFSAQVKRECFFCSMPRWRRERGWQIAQCSRVCNGAIFLKEHHCQTKRRSYIYLVVEPTPFEKYARQNGLIFPK